jgi:hexosaminidase
MFPFHGKLINKIDLNLYNIISPLGYLKPGAAGNAYSQEDILELNNLARINKFEVIPLVQTFGHLEMFLKLPEFRHLRELDEYPQAICPSNNNSFTLVTQIIDQVMSLNPQAKWLHVGCDEVFHIGYCDKCRMKDRDTLFLDHVARVSKYVRDKHNVIPIIWDDMMRQISSDRIKQVKMESIGVEIMIWTYIKGDFDSYFN